MNYDTEELEIEKDEKSIDIKKKSKKEKVIQKKKESPNTKIH